MVQKRDGAELHTTATCAASPHPHACKPPSNIPNFHDQGSEIFWKVAPTVDLGEKRKRGASTCTNCSKLLGGIVRIETHTNRQGSCPLRRSDTVTEERAKRFDPLAKHFPKPNSDGQTSRFQDRLVGAAFKGTAAEKGSAIEIRLPRAKLQA